VGHRRDAWAAPGCPELDNVNFARFKIGDVLAFDVSIDGEGGNFVADCERLGIFGERTGSDQDRRNDC
jgi:hypothetical protein